VSDKECGTIVNFISSIYDNNNNNNNNTKKKHKKLNRTITSTINDHTYSLQTWYFNTKSISGFTGKNGSFKLEATEMNWDNNFRRLSTSGLETSICNTNKKSIKSCSTENRNQSHSFVVNLQVVKANFNFWRF